MRLADASGIYTRFQEQHLQFIKQQKLHTQFYHRQNIPFLLSLKIMSILVPGGLGYVGSHTVLDIFEHTAFHIIIVDDLSNCTIGILDRMKKILSKSFKPADIQSRITFREGNVLDLKFLESVFAEFQEKQPITHIMHFAAKKCVPESTTDPILYYQNNLVGSLNLFKCMEKFPQCIHFIFSSTATVYGEKHDCQEGDQIRPIHPYAETKVCVEMLMKSLAHAHKNWKLITLRYFNPCSSHPSGLIGDEPSKFPNNLFPFIQQVVTGNRPKLYVFGTDYKTHDGTGVRDYLHIMDLASGHVAALRKFQTLSTNYEVYNLGTGVGLSVFDIIKGFEKATGSPLPYEIADRRPGDVAILVAKADKANQQLNWRAEKTLDDMCRDCLTFIRMSMNKESE